MASKFDSAFAAARKAGKKAFDYNGKSYNTKLAKTPDTPKKGPVPASRPKSAESGASRSTSGKTSATSGASRSTAGKVSAKSGATSTSGKVTKTEKTIPYTRDDSFSSKATSFVADVTKNGLAAMANRPSKSETSRANANKNVVKKK